MDSGASNKQATGSAAPKASKPAPVPAKPMPPPASSPAPAQWVPVRVDPTPAKPAPRPSAAQAEDMVAHASVRRGIAGAAAAGWIAAFVGLGLFAFTYFWGYYFDTLFAPSGLRGDYVAAILIVGGAIVGTVFLFLPARRAEGIGPGASPADWDAAADRARRQVQMAQIMVGVGCGLVALGLLWAAYWIRVGYLEDQLRYSNLGQYSIPSHYLGAILVGLGALLALFFWGKVASARRERSALEVGMASPPRPGATAAGALPAGVNDAEVRELMKRLDGLMAQLPDAAVTEFSKTPEADTYLKLLG